MSWILPSPRKVIPAMKRLAKVRDRDRHRPGYWRDYYAANLQAMRQYKARKAREYRAK